MHHFRNNNCNNSNNGSDNSLRVCFKLWNDYLQPNLGVTLRKSDNIAFHGKKGGGIVFGSIIKIIINDNATDLMFHCIVFEDWNDPNSKIIHDYKRRMFTLSNQVETISESQIVNTCRMIPYQDSEKNELFILHILGETGLPVHYYGLLLDKNKKLV